MPKFLLWDLDGTLTSPHVGIVRSIQYALEQTGRHVPSEDALLWCIGPPLHESFTKLAPGSTPEQVGELIAKYRERFAVKGLFENAVYPGIPEALAALEGIRHFVATSKPEVYARQIVEHFGLSRQFEQVYGSELSGERSDKGELIRYLLRTESLDPTEGLMIGDREHDVFGAKKSGMPCAGVLWGYGSAEELTRAGAVATCETPARLVELVLN